MSTDDDHPPPMPLAPDRPMVDGTRTTSAQLRAELAKLLAEQDWRRDAEARRSRDAVAVPAPVAAPDPAPTPDPAPAPAAGVGGSAWTPAATGGLGQPSLAVAAGAALLVLVVILVALRRQRGS